MLRRVLHVVVLLLISIPLFAATQGGAIPVPLPLFPANNWWNLDVSSAPTDLNSTNYTVFLGGTGLGLHPDFGGDAGGGFIYGFPYILVDGNQPKKTVDFVLYPE